MTPTKAELEALLARVEAAQGPNRELDATIAAMCRVAPIEHEKWALKYPKWIARSDGRIQLEKHGPGFEAPSLTASIDAALGLVPPNWTAFFLRSRQRKTAFVFEMTRLTAADEMDALRDNDDGDYWSDSNEDHCRAHGPTIPLAILAAVLRALIAERADG